MDHAPYTPPEPIEIDWPPRPPATRPRRPVDARLVSGLVGRVLIATGLLVFGFVAYQLWGTGIQQARSQDRLQDQFAARVGAGAGTGPPTSAAATGSGAATTVAPAPGPATSGAAGPPTTAGGGSGAPTTAAAPAAAVRPGDPVARLVIPKIGVDQVVVSGVDLDDLKKGPGHYPDTPLPGQVGNAAIAGHRSTFGAPFARVDELAAGDEIQVTDLGGARYVYRVASSRVVEPTEVDVVANTPDAELTLTSCWPKFSADKRIVIRALLDTSAGAVAAPAAPTTVAAATTAAPSTLPAGGDGTTVAAAATPPTTTADTVAARPTTNDVFRRGWWADDRAWGDVILWGCVLTAVSLAAWLLGRRTRNLVGALVGIGPFAVGLYFFYENAARLLPPSL